MVQLSATGMTDYRSHTFSFDHIFPPHVTNEDVYNSLCTPILNSAFNGIHGAVLCYGQTEQVKHIPCLVMMMIIILIIKKCCNKKKQQRRRLNNTQ